MPEIAALDHRVNGRPIHTQHGCTQGRRCASTPIKNSARSTGPEPGSPRRLGRVKRLTRSRERGRDEEGRARQSERIQTSPAQVSPGAANGDRPGSRRLCRRARPGRTCGRMCPFTSGAAKACPASVRPRGQCSEVLKHCRRCRCGRPTSPKAVLRARRASFVEGLSMLHVGSERVRAAGGSGPGFPLIRRRCSARGGCSELGAEWRGGSYLQGRSWLVSLSRFFEVGRSSGLALRPLWTRSALPVHAPESRIELEKWAFRGGGQLGRAFTRGPG